MYRDLFLLVCQLLCSEMCKNIKRQWYYVVPLACDLTVNYPPNSNPLTTKLPPKFQCFSYCYDTRRPQFLCGVIVFIVLWVVGYMCIWKQLRTNSPVQGFVRAMTDNKDAAPSEARRPRRRPRYQ